MGILDRLFGRRSTPGSQTYGSSGSSPSWGTPAPQQPSGPYANNEQPSPQQAARDTEAIRRYRYLLRTAPPEAIEQAHAEAFEQLSPDQRRQVLQQLSQQVPEHERARNDDPASLARMATRAELRQPGVLVQVLGPGGYGPGYGRGYGYGGGYGGGFGGMGGFGGGGMGMGMGGMIAGSLLASVAGSFIGTAIADEFFDHDQYDAFNQSIGDVDTGDTGGDTGSDIDFDNSNVDTSGVEDQSFADTGDAGYGDDGGGSDFGDFGDGGDFGGGDW